MYDTEIQAYIDEAFKLRYQFLLYSEAYNLK